MLDDGGSLTYADHGTYTTAWPNVEPGDTVEIGDALWKMDAVMSDPVHAGMAP